MPDEKKTFKARLQSVWTVIKKYAKTVWNYLKVAKMEYILMISLFVFDIVTKIIVNATTSVGQVVPVIPYFFNIANVHNYNAAFGSDWISGILGAMGARVLFCVFAVGATVVFIILLVRSKGGSKWFRVSLAMLAAGAMGNCIDRWIYGYVRDFIQIEYFGLEIFGSKTFYVFNVADAELVTGVIMIVIYFIFMYRDKHEDEPQDVSSAVVSTEGDAENSADNSTDDVGSGSDTQKDADNKAENGTSLEQGVTETITDGDGAATSEASLVVERDRQKPEEEKGVTESDDVNSDGGSD